MAALAIGLLALAAPAFAQAKLAVTGFQSEGDSPTAIDRSADSLTTVGVDGTNVRRSGKDIYPVDAAAQRQLARAHSDGLQAQLLVGNFDDKIGDFSEGVAHRLFSKQARIDAVASRLGRIVRAQGWDGIMIDFESMTRRDRKGLTALVRSVHEALPEGRSLSIAIQNSTNARGYAAMAYDLPAIAKRVDTITLMTYDRHGPWENTPGPIGPLGWQERGLEAMLRSVPASKIDLGVAGYGYAWRPHSNDTLSVDGARKLAGRSARWSSRAGEWTAHLHDGSTVWWSDGRSYRKRVDVANSYGLHGLALWSLGQADPIRAPSP